MRSINEYRLVEKSYRKATLFGILLIIAYLTLRFVFEININVYQNPIKVLSLEIIQITSYVALIITRIIAIIWTYRIATETERSGISWALFALVLPPIAIIAVANKTEKFETDEIEKIITKTRGEYHTKTSEIYNNHSMSKVEQNETIVKIKHDYDSILKIRLVDLKADSLIEHIQMLKEQEEIDVPFNNHTQKQVLVKDIMNNINGSKVTSKKCPACNSCVSDESIICSECEIILK